MHALANCIVAATNTYAALSGITLTRLEVALESDLDLHGYFGLDQNVRPGLSEVRVELSLAGEADAETLRSLAEAGYRYSPVRDSLANGVRLKPSISTER